MEEYFKELHKTTEQFDEAIAELVEEYNKNHRSDSELKDIILGLQRSVKELKEDIAALQIIERKAHKLQKLQQRHRGQGSEEEHVVTGHLLGKTHKAFGTAENRIRYFKSLEVKEFAEKLKHSRVEQLKELEKKIDEKIRDYENLAANENPNNEETINMIVETDPTNVASTSAETKSQKRKISPENIGDNMEAVFPGTSFSTQPDSSNNQKMTTDKMNNEQQDESQPTPGPSGL